MQIKSLSLNKNIIFISVEIFIKLRIWLLLYLIMNESFIIFRIILKLQNFHGFYLNLFFHSTYSDLSFFQRSNHPSFEHLQYNHREVTNKDILIFALKIQRNYVKNDAVSLTKYISNIQQSPGINQVYKSNMSTALYSFC